MSDKTKKLETTKSVEDYLDKLFEDASSTDRAKLYRAHLTEKEKQVAQAGAAPQAAPQAPAAPVQGNQPAPAPDASQQPATSKTMDDQTDKLKTGDIAPKDIIEKLNSIRSGKSFKDSAIEQQMEQYINSLSKPEKTALLAFLRGIAQIVTGEVAASTADDPSEKPADVQMQKNNDQKAKHVKPNVIKASMPKPANNAPNAEDTAAPRQAPPITPKTR